MNQKSVKVTIIFYEYDGRVVKDSKCLPFITEKNKSYWILESSLDTNNKVNQTR